ncbi:MAG: hypothetical protein HY904_16585 [Deltaproteobacteria bacterium]|nr:hypothetical protein [Deltaproteobacteria bacterium]
MEDAFTRAESRALDRLSTVHAIQAFLDRTPYSVEKVYRCPRSVLRDRRAHCFDGAVLAAAALERLGLPPLILDMRSARDDDHVLCVYRVRGAWGAVAKSNFVGLRGREPVYRSLRELVMSYFDHYFNMERQRSLRSFSRPLDLARVRLPWRTTDRPMARIAARLDRMPHTPVLTPAQLRALRPVDRRTFRAHQLGTDLRGVYWP